jgi:hypothetical protein
MGRNRFTGSCLIVTVAPALCFALSSIRGLGTTPCWIATDEAAASEVTDDRALTSFYGVGGELASHGGEMRQVAAAVPEANPKLMGREQDTTVPMNESRPEDTGRVRQRDYYRLEEGRIWTYRISRAEEPGIFLPALRARVRNLRSQQLNGHKVTPQIYTRLGPGRPVRFYSGFATQDEKGVCEIASQTEFDTEPKMNKPPRYIIRYPVEAGTHWQEKEKTWFLSEEVGFVMNYTIHSLDEVVTVPAGTFEHCLMVKYKGSAKKEFRGLGLVNITVEQMAWFAPGLGLVKSVRRERCDDARAGSGSQITELLSYE